MSGHLVRRRRLRDHLRPADARHLNGVDAEAAAGAGDEDPLARLDAADVANGREDGADRAGQDGAVLEADLGRQRLQRVLLDDEVIGVGAVVVMAVELALRTERLAVGPAEPAMSAVARPLHARDPVSGLVHRDVRSDRPRRRPRPRARGSGET
jgi:hypothetical protein